MWLLFHVGITVKWASGIRHQNRIGLLGWILCWVQWTFDIKSSFSKENWNAKSKQKQTHEARISSVRVHWWVSFVSTLSRYVILSRWAISCYTVSYCGVTVLLADKTNDQIDSNTSTLDSTLYCALILIKPSPTKVTCLSYDATWLITSRKYIIYIKMFLQVCQVKAILCWHSYIQICTDLLNFQVSNNVFISAKYSCTLIFYRRNLDSFYYYMQLWLRRRTQNVIINSYIYIHW